MYQLYHSQNIVHTKNYNQITLKDMHKSSSIY